MDKDKILEDVTAVSSDVIGQATGAAVGAVVAGPIGAAVGMITGSAVTKTLERIGDDVRQRLLSPKENERVGTVLKYAKKEIDNKINDGKSIRDDGFFESSYSDRSAGEEVLEGILSVSQSEYEEKKLVFVAKLYANIAFENTVSRAIANYLIKVSEEITYRQIVILSVVGFLQSLPSDHDFRKNKTDGEVIGINNIGIATECHDLYRRSLIFSSSAILDAAGINPKNLTLQGYGALLYNLMELNTVPKDEIYKEVLEFLSDSDFEFIY